MLVPELYSSHLAVQPQTGSAGVRAWTTGQILEATVVRQGLDGTVTLRIGSQEVQARTGLALAADQPLTLQVAQSGTQTVLRVLHASSASVSPDAAARPGATPPEVAALTQAWRQVLPRGGDAQPLLARLSSLLIGQPQMGTAQSNGLPPPVANALHALSTRLPPLESLFSAAGLKRAIGDSGLFLESQLGAATLRGEAPSVAGDYKANLLALAQTLRAAHAEGNTNAPAREAAVNEAAARAEGTAQATATVLRETDAALARVEQQQLANLSRPSDQPPAWLIEIPLRDGAQHSRLRLHIEADDGGVTARSDEQPWSVALDFDLAPLGPLHARISLRGDNVAATLWADQGATAELISSSLSELDAALRTAGLVPTALHCRAGTPPAPEPPAPGTPLVDERA